MDKSVIVVFASVLASMIVSSMALSFHPTECYIEISKGTETMVYVGHTLPKIND